MGKKDLKGKMDLEKKCISLEEASQALQAKYDDYKAKTENEMAQQEKLNNTVIKNLESQVSTLNNDNASLQKNVELLNVTKQKEKENLQQELQLASKKNTTMQESHAKLTL